MSDTSVASRPSDACLDDEMLAQWLDGVLPAPLGTRVDEHLRDCAHCRDLILALPRGQCRMAALLGHVASEHRGRYMHTGECGQGGQARVSVVYDATIGREVALKELITEPDVNDRDRLEKQAARFLREARIAGQLNHPGIVPVHEIGLRADGRPYYTMQLVRGRTLDAALASCDSLADRMRLLRHVRDLCHAIAYAHGRGVLHRDLKPQNVMIGEYGETVVLDWGLATWCHDVQRETSLGAGSHLWMRDEKALTCTVEGIAVGTPAYMSPEQAAGKVSEVSEASDIFGLGAVLYQLLTGKPPFARGNVNESLQAARAGSWVPVSALVPDSPPELASITHKALSLDKKARYTRAADMVADLDAFMTGRLVGAFDYTGWQVLRRYAALHKRAIAMATTVLSAVLIALAVVSWSLRNESLARSNEAAQRRQAELSQAAALLEGARADLERTELLEARAKLRASLEVADTPLARALWWHLRERSLMWRRATKATPHTTPAFSPDSLLVAIPCAGTQICLFDTVTAAARRLRDTVAARSLTFSLDGSQLASGSLNGEIEVWDLRSGQPSLLAAVGQHVIHALAYSPDGRHLVAAADEAGVVLVDLAAAEHRVLGAEGSSAQFIELSADGRYLAAGGDSGEILLWDFPVDPLRPPRRLPTNAGSAQYLAFSPDGRLLATGTTGHLVKVWQTDSGALLHTFNTESADTFALAFDPPSDRLVAVGADGVVRSWRLADGHLRERTTLSLAPVRLGGASLDAGHRRMAVVRDGAVELWQLATARGEAATGPSSSSPTFQLAFAPGCRSVALGCEDGGVWVVGTEDGAKPVNLAGHRGRITSLAFSPDGEFLATGSMDCSVRLWRVRESSELRVFHEAQKIHAVAFDPSGHLLATAGNERIIRLWDPHTGALVRELVGHERPVAGLAFSRDGHLLASAGIDGTARVWEVASGRQRLQLPTEAPTERVSFSPDGSKLYSAAVDGRLLEWNLTSLRSRLLFHAHERIREMALSSDGQKLIFRPEGGRVTLLEPSTLRVGATVDGADSFGLSPDGRTVATANRVESLQLWDAYSGHPERWTAALLHRSAELFTHRGWRRFDGGPRGESADWRQAIEERGRLAADAEGQDLLCMATHDDSLEIWDLRDDHLLLRMDLAGITSLRPAFGGCVALTDGELLAVDASGGSKTLATEVSAFHVQGNIVTAARQNDLVLVDEHDVLERLLMGGHATAVGWIGERLAVGYEDGTVDLFASSSGVKTMTLRDTPTSPVQSLLAGPAGSLVVGFTDTVGLWDVETGVRAAQQQLPGTVTHLLRVNNSVVAASSLGASLAWDLDPLVGDYCLTMQEVWREVPVLWASDAVTLRPAPEDHPCWAATAVTGGGL